MHEIKTQRNVTNKHCQILRNIIEICSVLRTTMRRWEDNIKVGVRDGVGGVWGEFTWLMLDTGLFGRL